MYSPEIYRLIYKEQYEDRLREMERARLLRAAGLHGSYSKLYRQAAKWLGAQMVKWGSKLQNFDPPDKRCQESSLKIPLPEL